MLLKDLTRSLSPLCQRISIRFAGFKCKIVQDGEVSFVVLDAREEKYFARKHNASCTDACELLMFKEDEPEEPYTVPGRRFAEEIQVDCYKHLLPVATWLVLMFSYFLTSAKALRIHGVNGGHGA